MYSKSGSNMADQLKTSQSPGQILQIEPTSGMVLEGPFLDVVPFSITLKNPTDTLVGFKVKTTAPKCYCVRPSTGYVDPFSSAEVSLVFQPVNYNPLDRFNHKFMIESVIIKTDSPPPANLLWKTPHKNVMQSKLMCTLKMPNEILIEPSRNLIFEGSFTELVSSTITLTNEYDDHMCYRIYSPHEYYEFEPVFGVVSSKSKTVVKVTSHPHDLNQEKKSEHIVVQSILGVSNLNAFDDIKFLDTPCNGYPLKCLFKNTLNEKVETLKASVQESKPVVPDSDLSKLDINKLLAELSALRQENTSLKESDFNWRRNMLSDNCQIPHESRANENAVNSVGFGKQPGTLSNFLSIAPPLLYLVLTFIFGLIFGRYIL